MTTPSDPDPRPDGEPATEPGVELEKDKAEEPFDPYRFGRPDHPIPPEYAPPGYVPDPEPQPTGPPPPPGAPPYGAPPYQPPTSPYPYGAPPYGQPGPPPYGPPQYGQPPYGQPGPPPYGSPPSYGVAPYGRPKQGTGKAVTAMVLGILSIVLCWLSILDALLVVPAVILGIIALTEARSRNGAGKGMALTGLICGVVGAVLAITATVLVLNAYDKCGGASQSDAPGFNECVKDNIF